MKLNFSEDRDTFQIEELLPEGKAIEIKAKLLGFKVELAEITKKVNQN